MNDEKVYLSLGSNVGDPLSNLLQALLELDGAGLKIVGVSSVYLTGAVGYCEQADFYNLLVLATTSFNPHTTLEICQGIEKKLGRIRTIRWGPRVIDIDIIFYGNRVIKENNLEVPHPRYAERAFVLIPLKEIAPSLFAELNISIPKQKVCLKIDRSDVKMMLSEKGLIID